MHLVVDDLRDMKSQRNRTGLVYARKAIIMIRIAFHINGRWEETLLTLKLQLIILKYFVQFGDECVFIRVPVRDIVVNHE